MSITLSIVLRLTSVAAVVCLVAPASGAAPAIHHLGTLGGTDSYGMDVNDAGQVAGYSYLSGNSVYHAFRYDPAPGGGCGIMRDLGTFGGAGNGAEPPRGIRPPTPSSTPAPRARAGR